MSLIDWAEKEVAIACEHENTDRKAGEFDYGCACYESALKAFKSLCEDGHSGFSIGMTKHILNRLIDGKPLRPILEDNADWRFCYIKDDDGSSVYQCGRMSALFKTVHSDGSVTYSDNNSYYCVDIGNPNVSYHNGLAAEVIEEMFPITLPYMPGDPVKVVCEDFLTDPKNGDFDTKGILYAIKPNGNKIWINRYFKESEDDFVEISVDEYEERRELALKRKGDVK